MGIPVSAVTYIGTITVSPPTIVTPVVADSSRDITTDAHLRGTETHIHLQAMYSVVAITRTQIQLSSTTYTSTAALYSSLTSTLTNAVSDGSYTNTMDSLAQTNNDTTLATASAVYTTSTPPQVISSTTDSNNDNKLSTGAIAGIVVAVVVVVTALLAVAVSYIYSKPAITTTNTQPDTDFAMSSPTTITSASMTGTINPVHQNTATMNKLASAPGEEL